MAFDLDNEELKATRKMHGQDDGLYEGEINKTANEIATNVGIDFSEAKAAIMQFNMSNKTSDKNVANIENLYKFANITFFYGGKVVLNSKMLTEVQKDIKNFLTEREQDKKRIQELEADLYNANKIVEEYTDSIPKQKVKEALEDIEYYFERLNGPDEDIQYIRQVKQELLEGEK